MENMASQSQDGGASPTSPLHVSQIPFNETIPWITKKHYAKRMPPISYAFGLFKNNLLVGVCTFGIPASRFEDMQQPYELNRLVVDGGLEKNSLSFFVSRCLKLFPKNNIIVSYADPNNGHHGYIYQATNWIYTGLSVAHNDWYINGQLLHEKTIYNQYGTNSVEALRKMGLKVESKKTLPKYRYFYFVGNNEFKNKCIANLKYQVLKYPKGENSRYDSSYKPEIQRIMF